MNEPKYASFDTKEMPGKIIAVRVVLDKEIIGEKDMDRSLPVDLCNHPLYKDLERYVLANPSILKK